MTATKKHMNPKTVVTLWVIGLVFVVVAVLNAAFHFIPEPTGPGTEACQQAQRTLQIDGPYSTNYGELLDAMEKACTP